MLGLKTSVYINIEAICYAYKNASNYPIKNINARNIQNYFHELNHSYFCFSTNYDKILFQLFNGNIFSHSEKLKE